MGFYSQGVHDHRRFYAHLNVGGMTNFEVRLLVDAGQSGRAAEVLAGAGNALPPAQVEMLEEVIANGPGRKSVASLEAEYEKSQTVLVLHNLVGALANEGYSDRLLELWRRLIRELKSLDEAEQLIHFLRCRTGTRRPMTCEGQVRILCRKRRYERPDADFSHKELLVALIGAAAHSELEEWLKFVAAWIEEITFAISDKAQAGHMLNDLNVLCVIEPRLRSAIGRSMAGLELFARA